ncbi:alpha/beta hydrolase family protein [Acidobacteriota bacterium]
METLCKEGGRRLLGVSVTLVLIFVIFSVSQAFQESEEEKKAAYAKSVIKGFTSGEIIELKKIPDNKFFDSLIKDQAGHEGITEEEQRKIMMNVGVMKYVIGLLRDGQISLTEYVNLRPDIHWVEALRMAYVGGGLELSPSLLELLSGKVTEGVKKLRAGKDIIVREVAYSSSVEDLSPLYADVAYNPKLKGAPVMVHVHGDIPGTRMGSISGVHYYAQKGFFGIAPSQRGRDNSAGECDVFGREIYDIYDAVEYAKKHYGEYLDPTNINITGGSAGGMASISAVVHFPDYFRMSIPYYGSADTGDWLRQEGMFGKTHEEWLEEKRKQGWPEGSLALFNHIIRGIGGMPDEVPDKLMTRNKVLGAMNCPYTEVHMIWDQQDGVAPSITKRNHAFQEKAREMGLTNVHIHYSERGDPIRYLHWITPDNTTAQRFFIPKILAGTVPPPVLADAGRMVVLGFLKTKRFLVWLGEGDDAVARLDYQMSPRHYEFRFRRLSNDKVKTGKVIIPNSNKDLWDIKINHQTVKKNVNEPEIEVQFGLDDVVVITKTS